MAKIDRIRVPVTDQFGRDIFTWEKVDIQMTDRTQKHIKQSKKNWENKVAWATNGMVYIEWLGYVAV